MELDALREADCKTIYQSVKHDEGLSEEQFASLNRRVEYFDKSAFSKIKKWVIYTLGVGLCLFLVFLFLAGIYLGYEYLGGLLQGKPNENLGKFLSTVVITILFSLSTLFLQGLFRKR